MDNNEASRDRLILSLHDLSMEKDEIKSCIGRMGKVLIPAFHNTLDAERERGTSAGVAAIALTEWAVGVIHLLVLPETNRENQKKLIDGLSFVFRDSMHRAVEAQNREADKGKK